MSSHLGLPTSALHQADNPKVLDPSLGTNVEGNHTPQNASNHHYHHVQIVFLKYWYLSEVLCLFRIGSCNFQHTENVTKQLKLGPKTLLNISYDISDSLCEGCRPWALLLHLAQEGAHTFLLTPNPRI